MTVRNSKSNTDHIKTMDGEGISLKCMYCGGTVAVRPSIPLSKINDLLLFAESLHGECKPDTGP